MNIPSSSPESTPRRSRTQAWILTGVFFAPLLLAFALYYGGNGWRPPGSTNQGELIDPARPLPAVALHDPSGAPLGSDLWRQKWTLVYIGDGSCDTRCREALTLMRQTRLALNDDLTRVQRLFIVTGDCCDQSYLQAEHAGLILANGADAAAQQVLPVFPAVDGASGTGRIYIVDPLGNLMMSYAPDAPQKALLEDLKKLLKLSHIG
jgi:cytochrome oxidase Cu insertion factor (SCO1/SenC/PrrC family)